MTRLVEKQTGESIVRNVIYGALTWVLPLGLNLIATPVIVRSLGNRDYGIYALILGFIGYSFTFNFGRAITKYIAEYRNSGDMDKIRDIVSASFFISVVVGLTGVALICGLAGWLVTDVFQIEAEAQQRTIHAMYIAAGVIFFWGLNLVFNAVLQGLQRFDVYSKLYTGMTFALTLGNLALAYAGFDLRALLAWNLLVLLLSSVAFFAAAKRLLPGLGVHFRLERSTVTLVLRYSFATLLYQIFANILVLFERGWITQRLGTESLTYYAVPLLLGIYLHSFIVSLVLVIFPLASELRNEREKLLRLYLKATKVISLIIFFVAATVMVQASIFMNVWMGADFAGRSSNLLMVQIVCFGLISIMTVAWQMTEGLGYPHFNAAMALTSTTIAISGMLALTDDFGNLGVALGRLSGFAVVFLSVFLVERWFFGRIQISFWLRLIASLALASGAAAACEYALNQLMQPSWPSLMASVLVGGAAYGTVLWMLGFITEDERILFKRILGR
jgi:O-antigen/teichoic acid export membrane protein